MIEWLTNCPGVAAKLRAADEAYKAQREAAANLPLVEKVKAYSLAKVTRQNAYNLIQRETATFPIIAGEGPGIGVMVEQALQRFAEQGSDVLSLSVDISAELWRGMGGRTTRDD